MRLRWKKSHRIIRTVYPTTPPQVDYKLTVLGRSLWEVVHPLGVWAKTHMLEVTEAREAFDLTKQQGPDV